MPPHPSSMLAPLSLLLQRFAVKVAAGLVVLLLPPPDLLASF